MVKFQFLPLLWITFPSNTCQILYSFCTSLLYSLMGLISSSLSPPNQHLPFDDTTKWYIHKLKSDQGNEKHKNLCYVFPIFALTYLVLKALFWVAIWRDSVFLSRFLILRHVLLFSSEIYTVFHLKYPHSCFPSHFFNLVNIFLLIIMLSELFLVAVDRISLVFSM